MSVPVRAHRDQPDYSFLVQHPLGGPERGGWRTGEAQSPFAELMESLSAARPHTMRQASFQEPSTPQTVSWTWETVWNQ